MTDERNFVKERIQLRHAFKDVLEDLRILAKHHNGMICLTPEEIEQHAMSVDFAMEDICETIELQTRTFVPDLSEDDHESGEIHTREEDPKAH